MGGFQLDEYSTGLGSEQKMRKGREINIITRTTTTSSATARKMDLTPHVRVHPLPRSHPSESRISFVVVSECH